MADMTLSPTTRTKRKTIEAANRIRHGSPKLHEVLRQKCRQQIRERRGQLFNTRRIGIDVPSEDVQETLTNIVRQEFKDLITNTASHNSVFDNQLDFLEALAFEEEIMAEEEQWIIEEYETFLQSEQERLERETVFCPVCQTTGVEEILGFICCSSCNLKIPTQVSLAEFKNRILESANEHSSQCIQRPFFSLFPFNNNIALYLTCDVCCSFTPVFGEGPIS